MNEKQFNEDNQSFYQKIKTDKKYKAKVQLLGYGVVIALIILYLNISSIGNNYNYDKGITSPSETKEETKKETNLLEKLNNNYTYNIDVLMKKIAKDVTGKEIENEVKYNYNGKSFEKNIVINKIVDNLTVDYYKIDTEYYKKENEKYTEIKKEIIYDILENDFIETEGVKKYIEISHLDHYTNYSSGKKEYLYNLNISDVIQNYKEDKVVPINITIENEVISITADYTELLKITDNNMIECIVNYTYKDINSVEEFVLIDDSNSYESDNTNTDLSEE